MTRVVSRALDRLRVYFVGDTSTSSNWGCRSTTTALRSLIASTGAVIGRSLYLSQMVSEDAVRLRNGDVLPAVVPQSSDELERYAEYVRRGLLLPDVGESIAASDIVLINGEGAIYDAQVKGLMQLFMVYLAKVVFHKPVVLVNFTAELSVEAVQELARIAFPLCDDIVFREPISEQHVHTVVGTLESVTAADAAFTLQPTESTEWRTIAKRAGYFAQWPENHMGLDLTKPYVCLAGSSIYFRSDRPHYDPVPGYLELALGLLARDLQVVCCVPGGSDRKIFEALAHELGLPRVGVTTPTLQALDLLANAELLISGRWHPSILSSLGGAPPIMLTANTHKTAAIPIQLELDAQVFDALNLRKEVPSILALADEYLAQGSGLRGSIRERAHHLAKAARTNVRFLEHHAPKPGQRVAEGSDDRGGVPLSALMNGLRTDRRMRAAWWGETKMGSIRQMLDDERARGVLRLLRDMVTEPSLESALVVGSVEAALAADARRFREFVGGLAERQATTALLLVGKVLTYLELDRQGETAYHAVLAFKPSSRAAHLRLAQMMLADARRDEAIDHLVGYLRVTPGTDANIELLAQHALDARRSAAAIQALERLLEADNEPPEQLLGAFVRMLPAQVDPSTAHSLIERIRDRAPATSPVRTQASTALEKLSRLGGL